MKGDVKELVKSMDTNRYNRHRALAKYKNSGIEQFEVLNSGDPEEHSLQNYGLMWCREIKGDKNGRTLPTVNEMLDGLVFWISTQDSTSRHAVGDLCHDHNQVDMQSASFKGYKQVMESIKKALKMSKASSKMNVGGKDENSLNDPYSKVTCLIFYLFSMQFGEPPLYSEVNRVSR